MRTRRLKGRTSNVQRPTFNVQRRIKTAGLNQEQRSLEDRLSEFAKLIGRFAEAPRRLLSLDVGRWTLNVERFFLVPLPLAAGSLLGGTEELIKIFSASLKTAEKNTE